MRYSNILCHDLFLSLGFIAFPYFLRVFNFLDYDDLLVTGCLFCHMPAAFALSQGLLPLFFDLYIRERLVIDLRTFVILEIRHSVTSNDGYIICQISRLVLLGFHYLRFQLLFQHGVESFIIPLVSPSMRRFLSFSLISGPDSAQHIDAGASIASSLD